MCYFKTIRKVIGWFLCVSVHQLWLPHSVDLSLMQLDSAIKNLVAYSLQQTLELAWHGEIHQPSLLDIVQVVIQHLHSSLPLDVGQLELWLLQGIQRFFGFAKCQIRMY